MKKVTGIGGIFFKCDDPAKMNDWYKKNLGFNTTNWGTNFDWRQADSEQKGSTVWSPFPKNTTYFKPSEREFMINYIVEDMEGLVEQLKAEGVTILDDITDSDFGKFVHILDPEGNKVELWQPKDEG